jgi:hypothetical protein
VTSHIRAALVLLLRACRRRALRSVAIPSWRHQTCRHRQSGRTSRARCRV